MHIEDLRKEIDQIDEELIRLFIKRMGLVKQVAAYKKENNLPIFAPGREKEKLEDVAAKSGADMADYTCALYAKIFEISKNYQSKCNDTESSQNSEN